MVIEKAPAARSATRGSILAVVLVALLVAASLGVALASRTLHVSRSAGWGRDRFLVGTLVDSALEELYRQAQEGANRPGDPTYELLRSTRATPAGSRSIPLPWLRPTELLADARRHRAELGGDASLFVPGSDGSFVHLSALAPISKDTGERAGILRFHLGVTLAGKGRVASQSVRAIREFSVVRAGLPSMQPDPGTGPAIAAVFREYTGGQGSRAVFQAAGPGCTRVDASYRALRASMTSRFPDGFGAMSPARLAAIDRELDLLSPGSLAERAQFKVVSDPQFAYLLARQLGGTPAKGLWGTIHYTGTGPLSISFDRPPFHGRCVIASARPLIVSDVKLADPRVDGLTLVSPRIVVRGKTVEAGLVSWGAGADGVYFAKRTRVLGPVLATRFIGRLGISGAELGDSEIGSNPAPECAGRDVPGDQHPEYLAVFSPAALGLLHRQE